ncbi:hypothetical protein [Candidatus Ichthyocystis sparus]|nr:hypothetical protein [Candidatus Ichthyocystis sparus]
MIILHIILSVSVFLSGTFVVSSNHIPLSVFANDVDKVIVIE